MGLIDCKHKEMDGKFIVMGSEFAIDDGDPAMFINSQNKLLHYSRDYSLKSGIQLKAKILEVSK